MSEVDLTARIGGDVQGLLSALTTAGVGVRQFAGMAASALVSIGVGKFLEDSIKVAQTYEVANAKMKTAVMNTSGATVVSAKSADDAAKAHDKLTKAQDALTKLEITQGAARAKGNQTTEQSTIAAMKLKEAQDKVTTAQEAYDKAAGNATASKNAVVNWDSQSKAVDTLLTSVSKYSAFSKLQLTDAFTNLTTKTGSSDIAMRDLKLASDMARGGHMDLATATTLLAKVEDGRVSAVQRALPFLDKSMSKQQALSAIEKTYADQAGQYADTTAGKIDKWKNSTEELQKAIGDKLLPLLSPLVDKATSLVDWFTHLDPKTQDVALKVAAFGTAALVAAPFVSGLFGVISSVVGVLSGPVGLVALALAAGFALGTLIDKIKWVQDQQASIGKWLNDTTGIGGSGASTVELGVNMTHPGFAVGGVSDGPSSGYPATLHGRERIIPDARSYAPQARAQVASAARELGMSTGGENHYHFPGVTSRREASGIASTVQALLGAQGAPILDFGG